MQATDLPSHEAITQRAKSIWNRRGQPHGDDDSIWFEAEQQLSTCSDETTSSPGPTGRVLSFPKIKPTPEPTGSFSGHAAVITAPDPEVVAANVTLKKASARAPRLPTHKNAPHAAPAESGKPLWNQPHSS